MPPPLSSRGTGACSDNSGEKLVWEVCSNLWDPKTNPNGYVSLGMAENSLMHEELRNFLSSKPLIDLDSRAFTYGDGPTGSQKLTRALATFFNDYFTPAQGVDPEHMMVANGVTSAIEHLAWAIANPGEGILVGRPYYRAFIMDMELRPEVRMVPVSFGEIDPCGLGAAAHYERVLLDSRGNGVNIRAIMLCHPHNPLGRCYSKEAIEEIMRLCEKYQVHLISDEIYALSTWNDNSKSAGTDAVGFASVLSMQTKNLIDPGLVHVVWGTSKDFGANGLRLGVIVSQSNPDLLSACRSCGIFSSPSSLAENATAHLLSDRCFLDNYIKTNKQRLSTAYVFATRLLEQHGIEYMPGSSAGFFLWINLGKKWQETRQEQAGITDTNFIYRKLLHHKIFTVSGDATGAEEAGWFRIVFSQRQELVEEAIRRIANVV